MTTMRYVPYVTRYEMFIQLDLRWLLFNRERLARGISRNFP